MEELYSLFGGQGQSPQLATASPMPDGGLVTEGQDSTEGVALFAPAGISYAPAEGEQLLLLPFGDYYVCVGAQVSTQGVAPGELVLKSAGGAVLQLKNSGEVCINGLTISKDGRLLDREEG